MAENGYDPRTHHIVFVHHAKAAGTTLSRILDRGVGPGRSFHTYELVGPYPRAKSLDAIAEHVEAAEAGRNEVLYRLIAGHMPFGLHTRLSRPCVYISMVRNPVERCISYYRHIRRDPSHRLHDAVNAGMTLREMLESRATTQLENGQVPYFAGASPSGEAEELTAEHLHRAKANISRHFAFVGTFERFDASYAFLCQQLGWRMRRYRIHNVSQGHHASEAIDEETRRALVERNALDLALYDWISQRLEEQIERAGRVLAWRLAVFGLLNRS